MNKPTRPVVLIFKGGPIKGRPGYRLERHRWHRAEVPAVFAPARRPGETRGATMVAETMTPEHLEPLARATADFLVRTPAVQLPRKTGPTLRADALRVARETAAHMRRNGLAIINRGSGALIELSTKGLKHAKSHTGDERAARLLFRLPSALSRAVYFKTELPDPRKSRQTHIVAYHKFAVPVEDGSGLALAVLHVEEDDHGAFYYDAAVSPEIDRLEGKPPERYAASADARVPGRLQAYLKIIRDALKVKPGLGEVHTFFRKAWVPALAETRSRPMTALIDLADLPPACCNHGLETLFKSLAEQPEEALIWLPHPNPWLADLCEATTAEGQARLLATQDALLAAMGIAAGPPLLAKADTQGWTAARIGATVAQLSKPLADYAPGDWQALVDLILATRLAPDGLVASADVMLWRAHLAGQLDALHQAQPALAPHETLLQLILRARPTPTPPNPWLAHAWQWAKARVGILIQQVSDNLRARLAGTIIGHIERHGTAQRGLLEQTLRDTFGAANRDWRRIAITEAGEAATRAYVNAQATGTQMERLEAYEGACPFCKRINGLKVTWSDTPLDESFGWTHIWPGKSNEGRSASPRKRTADGLVERTESELWWPTEGLIHPSCRGRWLALPSDEVPPGVDPAFAAWVKQQLDAA